MFDLQPLSLVQITSVYDDFLASMFLITCTVKYIRIWTVTCLHQKGFEIKQVR